MFKSSPRMWPTICRLPSIHCGARKSSVSISSKFRRISCVYVRLMTHWFYAIADSAASRYFRISVDDIDCLLAAQGAGCAFLKYDYNSFDNSIPSLFRMQRPELRSCSPLAGVEPVTWIVDRAMCGEQEVT